jgi:Uma2 family endonuclease
MRRPPKTRDIFGVLSSQPHIQDLIASERVRPLRRLEYERMVDEGFFGDEHIELLDGVIIEMTPQGTRHAATVQRLTDRLAAALGARASLRVQLPFAASETSEPEPDLAVVPPGDYDLSHPAQALLVIEVADSSLSKDRQVKAAIYAAAGIPEYWLVDLATGVIEVRKQPTGDGYAQARSARAGDRVRLRALPDVEIAVSDIVR